jgi:GDPmannose 4,6-dehydratase
MKALIFGANGQDGYYLHQLLLNNGIESIGISRQGPWMIGDVGDYGFVSNIISTLKPDYIFHIAANSTTSHEVWMENHKTICDGTLYILEAVKKNSLNTRVFISGSGLQFKNEGIPIDENVAFAATSPYAVSRIHSVYTARYYRSFNIPVYVGYFFNHESPLRSERHMSKKISSFAQRIAKGSNEQLEIGDIATEKEWTFAGDIAEAMWTLVNQEQIFESVIGSGVGYSIKQWLNECFALVNIDWEPYVKMKEDFTPEYRRLISAPAIIKNMGWSPRVSFPQLAKMMMQYNGK